MVLAIFSRSESSESASFNSFTSVEEMFLSVFKIVAKSFSSVMMPACFSITALAYSFKVRKLVF